MRRYYEYEMFMNVDSEVPEFTEYKDATQLSENRAYDANQIPALTSLEILNGYKWKGKHWSRKQILAGFYMRVPENRSYCLIGPKRCGKTTIIQIIAGLQSLDKGIVEYRGRCVPYLDPHLIGYMPQEYELHPQLTLYETLKLHGLILDMSKDYLQDRISYITHIMNFHDLNLKLSEMTHTQLCRTGFALAILHEPDFLLLDEPTTGADSLLRHEFRLNVRRLLINRRTSVIITSHDFDEAIFCDVMGLMRDGRMIAEGPPEAVKEALGAKSLLGVFYITAVGRGYRDYQRIMTEIGSDFHMGVDRSTFSKLVTSRHFPPRFHIVFLLIWVSLRLLTRQVTRTLALLLLPAFYIYLFGLSVGPSPTELKLGFMEEQKYEKYADKKFMRNNESDQNLVAMILEGLSKPNNKLKEEDDVEQGIKSVMNGKTHAFLWFPQHADLSTSHIAIYFRNKKQAPDLELYVDPTNYLLQEVIKDFVVKTFRKASDEYYGVDHDRPTDPIIIDAYPEDKLSPEASLLVWGGVSATSMALAALLSVSALDFSDRVRVEGVSSCEIHTAYLLVRMLVLCLQNVFLLIAASMVTGLATTAGTTLALFRCWVILGGSSFCGIALGVFVSTILKNQLSSMRAVVYIMCLLFLISGVFWPIEGISWPLHRAGYPFPIQHTGASLKFLVLRNMKLTQFLPWFGFLLAGLWGVVLYLMGYIFGRLCV